MVKYKKIFLDYWGYSPEEYIPCTGCNAPSDDLHHLVFKSHGGKDEVKNLAPVCRNCHNKAHSNKSFNNELREKHQDNIKRFTKSKPEQDL